MKKIIALLTLILTLQVVHAQSPDGVLKEVSTAITKGDAQALSGFFNSNVEVTVPGADKSYSSQQATIVIKDFFGKHKVTGYKMMHKGNSGPTHYQTGTLNTASGTFDVNVFVKQIGGKFLITQIRFEED